MSEEGAVAPGKRQKLVEELAATEVSYVSSLIAAQELFLQPLLRKLGTDEEVLTAEEVSVVFGNLQELIQADKQLLFELQSRVGSWDTTSTIGDVFLSIFSDEFVLEYCTYVSHYGEAVKFLRRLRLTAKEHPALRYIAAQESKAQASAVNNLTSLLITPIQRVPRYVMILKDLARYTPEGHEDHALVTTAYEKMEAIAHRIDDETAKLEEWKKIEEALESLPDAERCTVLMWLSEKKPRSSYVRLLGKAEIMETSGPSLSASDQGKALRIIYVLNHALIAVKSVGDGLRCKWWIDLTNARLNSVVSKESGRTKYTVVYRKKDESFPFTSLERCEWEAAEEGGEANLKSLLKEAESEMLLQSTELSRCNLEVASDHVLRMAMQPADWEEIMVRCTQETFPAGAAILQQGKKHDQIYFVRKGSAKVVKKSRGLSIELAVLEPGDMFGEVAYLSASSHVSTASVVAAEDTTVFMLQGRILEGLLRQSEKAELAQRFILHLCASLARISANTTIQEKLKKYKEVRKVEKLKNSTERTLPQAIKRQLSASNKASLLTSLGLAVGDNCLAPPKSAALMAMNSPRTVRKANYLDLAAGKGDDKGGAVTKRSLSTNMTRSPSTNPGSFSKVFRGRSGTVTQTEKEPDRISSTPIDRLFAQEEAVAIEKFGAEALQYAFHCKYVKSSGKVKGKLYLMDSCLGFYARSRGFGSTKLALDSNTITGVSLKQLKLAVSTKKKVFYFGLSDTLYAATAYGILSSRFGEVAGTSQPSDCEEDVEEDSDKKDNHLETNWKLLREAAFTVVHVPTGEPVIEQGRSNNSIYQVLSGKCAMRTCKPKHLGKFEPPCIATRTLTQGMVFNETSFLFGGACTSTVTAQSSVTVAYFKFDQLQAAKEEHNHLLTGFFRSCAELLCQRVSYGEYSLLSQADDD